MTPRAAVRWFLTIFYFAAGVIHLARPAVFLTIMPGWVAAPGVVVALTGMAEIAGAAGLAQSVSPALRKAAGWGLAAYALCVWPANVNHMLIDLAGPGAASSLAYHVPRLLAQPLLIWAAAWASGAIDWPRRPNGSGPAREHGGDS